MSTLSYLQYNYENRMWETESKSFTKITYDYDDNHLGSLVKRRYHMRNTLIKLYSVEDGFKAL